MWRFRIIEGKKNTSTKKITLRVGLKYQQSIDGQYLEILSNQSTIDQIMCCLYDWYRSKRMTIPTTVAIFVESASLAMSRIVLELPKQKNLWFLRYILQQYAFEITIGRPWEWVCGNSKSMWANILDRECRRENPLSQCVFFRCWLIIWRKLSPLKNFYGLRIKSTN